MKAYLEIKEIEQLENVATCSRGRLLIRILTRLGCRVSEALALKVEDIDFARGTVTIQHLKSRIKLSCPSCDTGIGKSHSFCPKCGASVEKALFREQKRSKIRTLPLDGDTLKMLHEYINHERTVSNNTKGHVFNVNRHRAWQIVRGCALRAGFGELVNPETGKSWGVSPHRLRDAFAVHAVKIDDSGDGLRLLQEHLGHASFNTTARYRKVAGEEHRAWYEKLWGNKGT